MSANYWTSTQCNHWLVDRVQLDLARAEDHQYASRLEVGSLGIYFSNLISTLCKRLSLRQRVVCTSSVFFHRFFAKNSYSALDPYLVAATCVYVAAKVEESPVHIKSVLAEATRTFHESGYRSFSKYYTDNASLAEMEFYLLEELEFDLIVYHPYRSLIALFDSVGNPSNQSNQQQQQHGQSTDTSKPAQPPQSNIHLQDSVVGLGIGLGGNTSAAPMTTSAVGTLGEVQDADQFGLKGLQSIEEMEAGMPNPSSHQSNNASNRPPPPPPHSQQDSSNPNPNPNSNSNSNSNPSTTTTGSVISPAVKIAEFDQHVLQMAWFVLNDTFKFDLPLMYPPYMIALAALWLALVLHGPSHEKISSNVQETQTKRQEYQLKLHQFLSSEHDPSSSSSSALPPPPKLPHLASLSSNTNPSSVGGSTGDSPTSTSSLDALTFFATLNVSIPLLAELIQEIISSYQLQLLANPLVTDGPKIVNLLESMREKRRIHLVQQKAAPASQNHNHNLNQNQNQIQGSAYR